MEKCGSLIWVTGNFGAGKSTLAKEAVKNIPGINFVQVLTIRSPRPDEKNSDTQEYQFVTKSEYETSRNKSKSWHHMPFGDNFFGTDAGVTNELLKSGQNFMRVVIPDVKILDEMKELYVVPPQIIWIDTPLETANDRIKKSRPERLKHRLQRIENREKFLRRADHIFKPSGDLKRDYAAFQSLIKNMIIGIIKS